MKKKENCLICYSDLTHPCLTPCGHDDICAICHLRLRHLHSDKKCPMCKQENQQVIVDSIENAKESFEEYPLWGNELGNEFFFREDAGMFYPIGYYEQEIQPLFGYSCGVCSEYTDDSYENDQQEESTGDNRQPSRKNKSKKSSKGGPLRRLQDHLRQKHHLTLCQLCVEFKRDFVSLLPRFTPAQLKTHLSKGDGAESGFKGHPLCEFCRPKRFYDLTQLHMHLQKEHYRCHVCDKQGLEDQYFRNYDALEHHFDRKHFLCKDPQCLAARFMVFENEIDLRAHELSMHGGSSTGSTKIQLEFKIRRSGYAGEGYESQTLPNESDFQFGLDGQAFVPEALPAANGPNEETSHPLHFQRTEEMRAQAAEMRAAVEEESKEEAFPTLGGGANSSGMRMGWTGNNPRINKKKANKEEEFPSLPASSGRQKSTATSKIRATTNRQFSAIQSAASNASNWREGAGSTAARVPSATISNSFFSNSSALRVNRQEDLATDNFPALGPASNPRASYPRNIVSSEVASLPARQGAMKVPLLNQQTNLSSGNFPSLGSASQTRATYPVNNRAYQKKKPPPSMDNFPSLGTGSAKVTKPAIKKSDKKAAPSIANNQHFPPPPTAQPRNTSVKDKMLKGQLSQKHAPLVDLKQGMATIDEIKSSLGTTTYKQLKRLTRDFATDSIKPDAYVEQTAILFGGGNDDFFRFVPALLMSCPNEDSAAKALRYIEDLRSAQIASTIKSSAASNTWSSSLPELIPESTDRQTKPSAKSTSGTRRQGAKGGGGKKKNKQKNELRALAFGGN